jgi:predicted component of type VI protein secretion system
VEFTGALPVAALRSTAKGRGAGEVQKPPELIGLVHILRILHKLKAWARESIGSSMSINERVAAINEQIGAYVLDTPKPRVELLQSRPLSSGRCEYVSGSTTTLDSYRLSFCLHKNLDYPVGELTTDIAMG